LVCIPANLRAWLYALQRLTTESYFNAWIWPMGQHCCLRGLMR
jgi:hypothetical protein